MWHIIADALTDAYRAVSGAWANIIGLVRGWPGQVSGYLGGLWSSVTAGLSSAYSTVSGWFDNLVGLARGLPGRISGSFGGMWDGILSAFTSAINGVINVWNELAGLLRIDIHVPIPLTKGINIDTGQLIPSLPHLAQGGLITATGLVYAHAGEAITPAPKTRSGPAVNIENLTLSDGLDVETFMRKAAWVAQTERV
jgi:phage-related protein